MTQPGIHLAFRFHVNFYHSYRGDTPDEAGFGQDIRTIRHLLKVLDGFNNEGVPVRGTWDIENAFSLGDIMPTHCPDIIEAWQRRVDAGRDEIEVMAYNNGLISAHTAAEFDAAISRALTNDEGSGLRDLFSDVAPVVRPQEMMYTPLHLSLYRRHNIEAISLFYSAVPFNAFSTFVPPLDIEHAYNPVTLTYPGIDETLTLLPARNHGDIADNLSLRRWIKRLRRHQRRRPEPTDLLLLIDADADDAYWMGYDWPLVRHLTAAAGGLEGLIASVADLDYVTFTTPAAYLRTHPPLKAISLGQDTADGAFDGYASWADKWSNHHLWTGIERARILELQTRQLRRAMGLPEETPQIRKGFEARLRALSTTHFGLAAPVMNRARLRSAAALVQEAVDEAGAARELALAAIPDLEREEMGDGASDIPLSVIDYVRGVSTETVTYRTKPSRALVRLPLRLAADAAEDLTLVDDERKARRVAMRPLGDDQGHETVEVLFVEEMAGEDGRRHDYRIRRRSPEIGEAAGDCAPESGVQIRRERERQLLSNGPLEVSFDEAGHPTSLIAEGVEFATAPLLRSAVRYARRLYEIASWRVAERQVLGEGLVGAITTEGSAELAAYGTPGFVVRREYLLVAGLPYLYVTTSVRYPETPPHAPDAGLVRRLGRSYDDRWQEVLPCELRPRLFGSARRPLRVWKHNYLDHVSSYDLDYGAFSRNRTLDSFNNHITHGWVAVSDGDRGLLIAHAADGASSFAFCPMRLEAAKDKAAPDRYRETGYHISLNPFGSYWGEQLHYPTARTGLGRALAVRMAETLRPWAPSYSGKTATFRLLIAPYAGDAPPERIQDDAAAFNYPYITVSTSPVVVPAPHTRWANEQIDKSTNGQITDGSTDGRQGV